MTDFQANPPARVTFELFDRSRDVNGNPTARYLLIWDNGETGSDWDGGSFRTPRRVQVGYRDKVTGGAIGVASDLFPGAVYERGEFTETRHGGASGELVRNPEAESVSVIFRTEADGSPVAFFPTLPADRSGELVTCYARLGQHSGASRGYYTTTKPAKPGDALEALRRELRGIGYNLAERNRWTQAMDATRRARA